MKTVMEPLRDSLETLSTQNQTILRNFQYWPKFLVSSGTLEASQTWEGTTSRGHFFLKKKGHFLKIKRALLCLLQNLGGHVPPVPPGSYLYEFLRKEYV